MQSFRTELENLEVEKDIIDLEKKIFQFKNLQIDEEKFRSLRLARGVYGQRQQGVQMVRIKMPLGIFSAQQLRRIADVSDEYSNGNLHITTRQDVQIHYVELDRTPELWAELEQDKITLREACGNTVRNVTASILAGIDPDEPFDITPYAMEFFKYFLRNPICQEMGRKFKVAFSSSDQDLGLTFAHDLGFIPKIENNKHGFKVMLGGGIGSQPREADIIYDFLPASKLIPFSECVIRVFDLRGERAKRNKARLKFLIKDEGLEQFLKWVEEEKNTLPKQEFPIHYFETQWKDSLIYNTSNTVDQTKYNKWLKTNVIKQKHFGFYSVGIPIPTGDISSTKARELAYIIEAFTGDDSRFTVSQSILLRFVKEQNLPALYEALDKIGLANIGFHKLNDIVACPGTDTCNLGITSSMGLAKELRKIVENEYEELIIDNDISIKISGCMNACGQHTIANIGFQGMTLKQNENIAPATQILLGGGILGNGNGRFADKVLKVPAKRTPEVLRWLLDDYKNNATENELFNNYYDRKTSNYFYQNLKHLSETNNLTPSDFIDWGNEENYEKAIGIGECAGVTIDLVQTLLFEAEECLESANYSLQNNKWSDAIYHCFNAQLRGAKALLTTTDAKINTNAYIIESFDEHFKAFEQSLGQSFSQRINEMKNNEPSENFAYTFLNIAKENIEWIKKYREQNAKQK